MSTLVNFSMKINGEWKNFTASIEDKTNEWGKNVNIWEAQTKEEREAKAKKTFVGGEWSGESGDSKRGVNVGGVDCGSTIPIFS